MQFLSRLSNSLMLSSKSSNKYFLAVLAIMIVPLSGVSTDVFVPSLPAIQSYFHTSQALAQLTVTAYLAGLGFMQLIAGGISDSFGRKKPFIVSTLLFLFVTILIPLSTSITEVIAFRFIQGVAVATMIVPMRAVISDLFEGKEFQKIVTYMAFAWTIGPIVAPFLGGYLQHYFGWEACFYFLLIYTAIAFVLITLLMPETSNYRHEFDFAALFKRYKNMLKNGEYVRALVTNGLLYAIVILFMTAMPFLTKQLLHFTPLQYGHLALFMGIAWSIGTLCNRLLINLTVELRAKICIAVILLSNVIFLFLTMLLPLSIYLLIPVIVMYIAGGMLITCYFAYGLSIFPKSAASANSLFGALVFLIPSIISSLGALLKFTTVVPLAIGFVVLAFMILFMQKVKGRNSIAVDN